MSSTLTNANNVVLNTYLVESFTRTNISKSAIGTASGSTTIHTVTAGKTLYITDITICLNAAPPANSAVQILGDTVVLCGYGVQLTTSGASGWGMIWTPAAPIPVAATKTVTIKDVTAGGGDKFSAYIRGFEV